MSFTSDLKKEIINRGIGKGKEGEAERKAALSAFVRTSGFLGENKGVPSFFIVSETENVAEFFMDAFSKTFNSELFVTRATMDKMSRRDKLLLQCPSANVETVLRELRLIKRTGGIREGISSSLIATDEQKIAYAKGAFLGGGSCTVPTEGGKAGYHLEFVFSDKATAEDFCDLLAAFELIVRLVERKETFVAYMKSKEAISDFLAIIGMRHSLKKFSELVEQRDKANHDNRAQNCLAGNADKTAMAAVKQVLAIKKLMDWTGFTELSEELKSTANARLQHSEMSLIELANQLGISKSCLNHRLRKLLELSQKLDEDKK
ncbi:MAG: DNA-binding protein WhiA [Clostridia bacterium]|nr:DNA-binding protein WhiA [Clostridia bacterium]